MVKCFVRFCTRNGNTDIGISFFRFPAESVRCDEWMRALGRPDLQGLNADKVHQSKYRVCGVHFPSNSFSSMLMNRLKKDAVPVNFPHAAMPGPYFDPDLNEMQKISSANDVTMQSLPFLKDDMVKELIPSMGHRAQFLSHWKNWKASMYSAPTTLLSPGREPSTSMEKTIEQHEKSEHVHHSSVKCDKQ